MSDTAATTDARPDHAPRVGRSLWRHLRWLWWLALPASCWLLDRLLLVTSSGEPLPDVPRTAALGLVFLLVQPIALGLSLRRVDDGGEQRDGRFWPALIHGGVHTLVFALLATAVVLLLWRGTGPQSGMLLRSVVWWLGYGGMWLGVWIGLRALRVPGIACQAGIGLAAALLATNLFWVNQRLKTLQGTPHIEAAIERTVDWSPMHGWLSGVLEQHIFRQGRMYINPDGDPLSIIGEYITDVSSRSGQAGALALRWFLLGVGVAAIGLTTRRARRFTAALVAARARPAESASGSPTPSTAPAAVLESGSHPPSE